MSGARRILGALLMAAALLPAHLLLDPARGGPAASATLSMGGAAYPMAMWGTVLALAAAVAMAVLLPSEGVRRAIRRLGEHAVRPPPAAWASGVGAVAFAAAAAVAIVVLRTTPTLIDEMAQLLHARALAAGALAAPLPSPEAARLVQNGVATPLGWASVYPPGHTVLLAAGLAAGAVWVVGPVLLGVAAAASSLAFERLLPERRAIARVAALLVAVSPFMVALGASYLSHTAAAAFGALALLAALRARDGSAGWAAAAGVAMGAMVAARPWTGLVLGATLTAGVWLSSARASGRGGRWLASRLGAWMAGGAPLAVVLGLWSHRLFGHPLRLGYEAAFGSAHGLGFHRDPWGNLYGAREALAYTGFDLAMLGTHLLETPLPLVALVGAWLAVTPRLPRGSGVLLAWALVPVAANALYWHHGYHMGPRMLYEAAPAWLALSALAVVGLARPGAAGATDDAEAATPPPARAQIRARDTVLWLALVLVAAAALLQVPGRLGSYRPDAAFLAASQPPEPPGDAPALVFAHGTWSGRVASHLAGSGMRRDSVETALRRNALCRVHLHTLERRRNGVAAASRQAPLDLEPLPGTPPHLRLVEVTPGNVVRVDPGEPLHPSCRAEIAADRGGVVELAPLLWRTALPGEGGGVLLVRDLGPADNRRVREAFPGREAWMWVPRDPRGAPRLMPYEEGEAAVWGEAPRSLSGSPGFR